MMSPDGKWVWDGQKWVPVAVHESVFPAYVAATAAAAQPVAAAPIAETMVAPPVNPFAGPPTASPFTGPPPGPVFATPPPSAMPAVVSPPIVQPGSYTARGATPPWQAWAAGGGARSRTLYMVAAFVAVAIGVIITIYFVFSQLPFLKAGQGNPNPTPAASPSPQLAVRSDAAVAQRWINSNLNSHLVLLQSAMTSENQACNGTISLSCQQGLQAMDETLPNALTAFDTPPPPCIARQVAKVQADLLAIQAAVKAGLKGYTDSNRNEVNAAIRAYNAAGRPFPADLAAISKAQAACDSQPQGP